MVRQRRVSDLGSSIRNLAMKNVYHDTVINGCLYFKDSVALDVVTKLCREKLLTEWRFRSTIKTKSDGTHVWETSDDEPDLDLHCKEVAIPTTKAYATQQDMYNYMASFYGKEMDSSRPLWECHTITNLKDGGPDGDSCGAVYMRIHHNIGDGISLFAVIMKLFDAPPIVSKRALQTKADIWPKLPSVLQTCHSTRMFIQGVFEGVLFTLLPGDINTAIKHPNVQLIGERRLATSKGVSLDKIKRIKNRIDGTVNDVLVTALSGVLRKYLKSKGSDVDGQIRALCLINMRNKEKMMNAHIELENQWNFLPIPVPCSLNDSLDRLYFCKTYCDDQKISPASHVAYNLNNFAGKILPSDTFCDMTYDLFSKCTTVFSNVPGPQGEVSIQGNPVQSISFFANSLTGAVFGLCSYNNMVHLSCVADVNIIPNPQDLVDHIVDEVEELDRATQGNFRKPSIDLKRIGIDVLITLLALLMTLYILLAIVMTMLSMVGLVG
eukprot:CFRG3486T1